MITSVIIPVWINDEETLQITKNCIESFKESKGSDLELILIDNAGKLGSGYLRSQASIYVRFPINLGYTVAVNAGLKLAKGDVIAIANNDIKVPFNWELICRDIFLQYPQVATIHPRMQEYDEPFNFGTLVAIEGKERWCQNSFVVTSREFLETLRLEEKDKEPFPGLFDENYGIGGGGDDWDFGFRVRKIGRQCYTNKTAFQHLHSYSLQKLGVEREKIVKQNNDYFTNKWFSSKELLFENELPGQLAQPWLPMP